MLKQAGRLAVICGMTFLEIGCSSSPKYRVYNRFMMPHYRTSENSESPNEFNQENNHYNSPGRDVPGDLRNLYDARIIIISKPRRLACS